MRIWVCLLAVMVVGFSVGVSAADDSRSGVAVEPTRDTSTLADADHAVVAYLQQRSGVNSGGGGSTRAGACSSAQSSARSSGRTFCEEYTTGACFDCSESRGGRWTCYVRWTCTSTSASVCQ